MSHADATLDDQHLRRAHALAHSAIGLSDPNPRVGCVIGDEGGQILGEGFTQHAGGPHAEVEALAAVAASGHSPRGATAWVTLEPCAHHGRTPPCCDALIGAGIARVVVAASDPHMLVAGRGLARLRAAGIRVDVVGAGHARATRELNVGFFSRVERGRPWVRLKVAASLDGRTALPNGNSQWITGPDARQDTHAWRKRASVVLTGIGTVMADDPRLDVRLVSTAQQPLRVVVDSSLRIAAAARILRAPGRCAIAYARDTAPPESIARLQGQEIELIALEGADPDQRLEELLRRLHERECNEVHVEAGSRLTGALLRTGLADELLVYLAPALIGEGKPMAELDALADMSAVRRLTFVDVQAIGPDLRLRLRPAQEGTLVDALYN